MKIDQVMAALRATGVLTAGAIATGYILAVASDVINFLRVTLRVETFILKGRSG